MAAPISIKGLIDKGVYSQGKSVHLYRIFYEHGPANGTGLFLPIDQGLEHGPVDFFPNPPSSNPEYQCRLAKEGNENARRIFTWMGRALGNGLASLINIFNFPLYLLSGGMLPAWDLFAPSMFEEAKLRSFTFRNSDTKIEKAILGNEAGLYGAGYLPFQAIADKSHS